MAKRARRTKGGLAAGQAAGTVRLFGKEGPENTELSKGEMDFANLFFAKKVKRALHTKWSRIYVKEHAPDSQLARCIDRFPDKWFSPTFNIRAWLVFRNNVLPYDDVDASFQKFMSEMEKKIPSLEQYEAEEQQRAEFRSNKGEFLKNTSLKALNAKLYIGERTKAQTLAWISAMELDRDALKEMRGSLRNQEDDYQFLASDPFFSKPFPGETLNAYNLRQSEMEKHAELRKDALEAIEELILEAPKAARAPRAPRKPREKSPDKIVERVKFITKSDEWAPGLEGLDSKRVLGKTLLFMYDAKYKWLKMFVAKNGEQLSFRGSTITGWDPEKSSEKRIRKPDQLTGLSQMPRGEAMKMYNGIKKEAKPIRTDRTNENVMFIRVL